MAEMNVTLCGLPLDNPVIPASGTFGYGYEFAELYDINILGTFSFKGTTKDPRFGNPGNCFGNAERRRTSKPGRTKGYIGRAAENAEGVSQKGDG